MSIELDNFNSDLADIFFSYAHITGAIELYMTALDTKKLQIAISDSLFDDKQEWKTIHRFMIIDGKIIDWYPALATEKVVAQKDSLLGSIYGIYLSKMIGCIDSYLSAVLQGKKGHTEKSGSI